ncbi:exocyst complex component 4-like isoform X4 [Mytilus trossulus]|uniref:exocyst complex component 4-like isoform X4 n=1 Tax=Mytilus trossulus TaxID=6551 RepID=UPI003006CE3A
MDETERITTSPSSKGRETSEFLMRIVRTLSHSADFEQREKEKARIDKAYKQSDKKLGELVTAHYEDLTKVTQDFSRMSKCINDSRERITKIREDLSSCKTLLHCKRDELRRLWIEGVEHKAMVALLDQVELIKEVPVKLDNFIISKHYLHATDLLVNAVAKLEKPLAGIDALRDLKAELIARNEQLHETLIEELNKQIYAAVPDQSVSLKRSSSYRRGSNLTKQLSDPECKQTKPTELLKPPEMMDLNKEIKEDLNGNPEENPAHFIAVLVEALFVLRKIPDSAERNKKMKDPLGIKSKIEPELSAIVARTSQQVVDSYAQQGESLSSQNQPRFLLELLENVFHQFRNVARMHKIVLRNLQRIIPTPEETVDEVSGVPVRNELLYDMNDVWSKIQAVLELVLREYLDVQTSSRQRAPTSFDEPSTDINSYFSKKKPTKSKKHHGKSDKISLFRFDASIHAMSTNSYVDDNMTFDTGNLFHVNLLSEVGLGKHQMVCKPSVNNITAIFMPLEAFIKEVEDAVACQDGTSSLQSFVTEFIQNIFLGQVHATVSTSIAAATKGFDALRHVVDHKTQKDLGVTRPLLTSTVTVDRNIRKLQELMQSLPTYGDQFLNMICNILKEYRDTCNSAYRGIVQIESDEKRVISATWAKDEDISRFLRSLPSWRSLQMSERQDLSKKLCSEEEIRTLNSKEALILISNLSSEAIIPQQEIITDVTQMRTIANVHESLEWFAGRLRQFCELLSARSPNSMNSIELSTREYPPVSDKSLESLKMLVKDFQDLAEICLLLLHLEVRVHCFYFLLPVAKQSNYAGPIDDLDPDSNVLKLNKDLSAMEEMLVQSLQPQKFKYIFESLGFLVSSILMSSIQYLKKINENGIKKMCRNLFAIQQNLTNITMARETDLDHARQYYELLYMNPDDVLSLIVEKGPDYSYTEYVSLFQLYQKSHPHIKPANLDTLLHKLEEVMNKTQNGSSA